MTTLFSAAIRNFDSQWKSRVFLVEEGEKGVKLQKPNGETFFLKKYEFENSHWTPVPLQINYEI